MTTRDRILSYLVAFNIGFNLLGSLGDHGWVRWLNLTSLLLSIFSAYWLRGTLVMRRQLELAKNIERLHNIAMLTNGEINTVRYICEFLSITTNYMVFHFWVPIDSWYSQYEWWCPPQEQK